MFKLLPVGLKKVCKDPSGAAVPVPMLQSYRTINHMESILEALWLDDLIRKRNGMAHEIDEVTMDQIIEEEADRHYKYQLDHPTKNHPKRTKKWCKHKIKSKFFRAMDMAEFWEIFLDTAGKGLLLCWPGSLEDGHE